MGRLINIDRLCNDLMERWSIADKEKKDLIRAVMADVITPIVASQPTVDAVPVVRCKDCARFDKKRGCNLVEGLNIAKTDSFCSYGERKDGDANEK